MTDRASSTLSLLFAGILVAGCTHHVPPRPAEKTCTVRLDLELRGGGWQDPNETLDYLWLCSESPELLSIIAPAIRERRRRRSFQDKKASVEGVPVGVEYQLYAPSPDGYVLAHGVVRDDGSGVARVALDRVPCVDPQGKPLDARTIAAWTFHRAGTGQQRWYTQCWSWDSEKELRGHPDGRFEFGLDVLHGRPDPGELVLGIRDDRRGMPWLARIALGPSEDALGLSIGDLSMLPTERLAAGCVVDDEGRPVGGAIVWLEALPGAPDAWTGGFPLTSALGGARPFADAEGRFEIFGISERADFAIYACAPRYPGNAGELGKWFAQWLDQPAQLVARCGTTDVRVSVSRFATRR